MSQIIMAIALWCQKPTASADMTMAARLAQSTCREAFIKCLGDSKKPEDLIWDCAQKVKP